MPRDPRPYVTYPINYTQHPRLLMLSDGAFRAFHEMNDYSRQNGLDGTIATPVARKKWSKRVLDELVKGIDDRPLVVLTDAGYFLRSYAEHQFTTADAADLREKRASAGAAGGRAAASARRTGSKPVASATESDQQNAAESESKSEIDKTDVTTPVAVLAEVDASDGLTDEEIQSELQSVGIRDLDRIRAAVERVVGPISQLPMLIDLVRAITRLATGHVKSVEPYIETTCVNSPNEVKRAWSVVVGDWTAAVEARRTVPA